VKIERNLDFKGTNLEWDEWDRWDGWNFSVVLSGQKGFEGRYQTLACLANIWCRFATLGATKWLGQR